jgi:hypothetical protein
MNHANYQTVYNQLSPSMKRFDDFGRDTIVMMFDACNKISDPHLRKTAVGIIVTNRFENGAKLLRKVYPQMSKKQSEWEFINTTLTLFQRKISEAK